MEQVPVSALANVDAAGSGEDREVGVADLAGHHLESVTDHGFGVLDVDDQTGLRVDRGERERVLAGSDGGDDLAEQGGFALAFEADDEQTPRFPEEPGGDPWGLGEVCRKQVGGDPEAGHGAWVVRDGDGRQVCFEAVEEDGGVMDLVVVDPGECLPGDGFDAPDGGEFGDGAGVGERGR